MNFLSAKVFEPNISLLIFFLIILLAYRTYVKKAAIPAEDSKTLTPFSKAIANKFYIDEIYLFITKKVVFNLIGRPAAWFDRNIVDGAINLMASLTEIISFLIRKIQSGRLQSYALYFMFGVLGFVLLFIFW